MRVRANWSIVLMTAAVLGFVLRGGVSQQPLAAQSSDQKVEEVFKNIKALNGQRADMLNPTMVLFEAALGVGCPYCHDNDANKREIDSKPQKSIARQMIEMVNSINKTTFRGPPKVTCFTCHEGRNIPIAVPNVTNHRCRLRWERTTSRVCLRRRPSLRRSPWRRCWTSTSRRLAARTRFSRSPVLMPSAP